MQNFQKFRFSWLQFDPILWFPNLIQQLNDPKWPWRSSSGGRFWPKTVHFLPIHFRYFNCSFFIVNKKNMKIVSHYLWVIFMTNFGCSTGLNMWMILEIFHEQIMIKGFFVDSIFEIFVPLLIFNRSILYKRFTRSISLNPYPWIFIIITERAFWKKNPKI